MTKKHFIAMADAIREHQHYYPADQFSAGQLATLRRFCASQNYNFMGERWMSYLAGECGPNGGALKTPSKPRTLKLESQIAKRITGAKTVKAALAQ